MDLRTVYTSVFVVVALFVHSIAICSATNEGALRRLEPRQWTYALQQQSNGLFYTTMFIGTPPQRFRMLVSTAMTTTQVPCSDCTQCGNQHQNYNFAESSSFDPRGKWHVTNTECNIVNACNRCVTYADKIGFESRFNESAAFAHEIGCCSKYDPVFREQDADGILALSRSSKSVVFSFYHLGYTLDSSVSMCIGKTKGTLVFGGQDNASLVDSYSYITRTHPSADLYNLQLSTFYVNGFVQMSSGLTSGVVDSTSLTTLLPTEPYNFVKSSFREYCELSHARCGEIATPPSISQEDYTNSIGCFVKPSNTENEEYWLLDNFPVLGLQFRDNDAPLCIPPTTYFIKRSERIFCVGIYPTSFSRAVLGLSVLRGFSVVFDNTKSSISWTKSTCAEDDTHLSTHNQIVCAAKMIEWSKDPTSSLNNGSLFPRVLTGSPTIFMHNSSWPPTTASDPSDDYNEGDDTPPDDNASVLQWAMRLLLFVCCLLFLGGLNTAYRSWRRIQPHQQNLGGATYINMTELRPIETNPRSLLQQ